MINFWIHSGNMRCSDGVDQRNRKLTINPRVTSRTGRVEEGRPVESLDIRATKSSGRQWYFCKSEGLTALLSNLHHMFCVIISRNQNNAFNNAVKNQFNYAVNNECNNAVNNEFNDAVNNTTNNAFFSSKIKLAITLCVL